MIAGLGNPGRTYEKNRHNVGFLFLDALSRSAGPEVFVQSRLTINSYFTESNFSAPTWQDKFGAAVTHIMIGGEKLHLIKPLSFMNRSGGPVGEFLRFYQIPPEELLVIHDEIDLPLGTLRLKQGGGDGGHNGIKSIAEQLGSKEFLRLRVGVGRPGEGNPAAEKREGVSNWVLSDFSSDERELLTDSMSHASNGIAELCKSGLKNAQQITNSALK